MVISCDKRPPMTTATSPFPCHPHPAVLPSHPVVFPGSQPSAADLLLPILPGAGAWKHHPSVARAAAAASRLGDISVTKPASSEGWEVQQGVAPSLADVPACCGSASR